MITVKAGSHNDAMSCMTSCWVHTSIYEHSVCTTHKWQCEDTIDAWKEMASQVTEQTANRNNIHLLSKYIRHTNIDLLCFGCLLHCL